MRTLRSLSSRYWLLSLRWCRQSMYTILGLLVTSWGRLALSHRLQGALGQIVLHSAEVSQPMSATWRAVLTEQRSPVGVKEGRIFLSSWAFAKSLFWAAFLQQIMLFIGILHATWPVCTSGETAGRWCPELSASEAHCMSIVCVCMCMCMCMHSCVAG